MGTPSPAEELTRLLSSARSAHDAAAALKQFQLGLARPGLTAEAKTALGVQAAGPVVNLLGESDVELQKSGLEALASIYPHLFKQVAATSDDNVWTKATKAKTRMLELWRTGAVGAKVVAVRAIHRVIQTQSTGSADPRRQSTAEPSLALVRPNHTLLKPAALLDEATKLLEELITALYTSTAPDVLAAIAAAVTQLVKVRPAFATLVVTALANWSPAIALAGAGASPSQVKSVEKVVKASLNHLVKTGHATAFSSQINTFLATQAARMDLAAAEAAREASRKRLAHADHAHAADSKRRRIDSPAAAPLTAAAPPAASTSANAVASSSRAVPRDPFEAPNLDPALRAFDVHKLEGRVVMELVVATLQNVPDGELAAAIEMVRRNLALQAVAPPEASFAPMPQAPAVPSRTATPDAQPEPAVYIKEEPIDPLKLDLGAEELAFKAEVVPEEKSDDESEAGDLAAPAAFDLHLADDSAELIAPKPLSAEAKGAMIQSALRRICAAGTEGSAPGVWVPLVARLVTRGLRTDVAEDDQAGEERRNALRQILFDFVVTDIGNRMEFAKLWLNEEWYTEQRDARPAQHAEPADTAGEAPDGAIPPRPYDHWLRLLLEHILAHSSNKDRSFATFIVDLPEIPADEITRLGGMCTNPAQIGLGFAALHDLAALRLPARDRALDVLFGLTTHADQLTRNAAINTIKRWVPESEPLSGRVQGFALHLLQRLRVDAEPFVKEGEAGAEPAVVEEGGEAVKPEGDEADDDDAMEESDDEEAPPPPPPPPPYALVKEGRVIDRLAPPTSLVQVTQYVELLLALCVKNPDLLDSLFDNYGALPEIAQKSLTALITPVVKVLGLQHDKLLDLIERCPDGSEELVFRLLTMIADKGKLPQPVIARVRGVAARKALAPKVLTMIISDCSKDEIQAYLLPILRTLNGTAEVKTAVRSVLLATMTPATQAFSAAAARAKPNLLTPVEMMVLLHKQADAIGLKGAIEAVGICFSMPDAFRPEILVAFMQQVVDEPVLPVLFLRTVIQAVTTYKTLAAFVSTTLLTRLIGRRIWEAGPLWEGFVRCAKAIAPHSFAALLTLPAEQLRNVMEKQPSLRAPLREYLAKKAGAHQNARNAALMELLAEGGEAAGGEAGSTGASTPVPMEAA